MTTSSPTPADPFVSWRDDYLAYNETVRGLVRHTLVARQLALHLPEPPARIAGIDGGDGWQSVPLARQGYAVALLDPSEAMLQTARDRLDGEPAEVRQRVRFLQGFGQDAPELLGEGHFDVVRCHGVRVLTDHLGNQPPGPDIDDILELEWQAGWRNPYRQIARLIHLIARRNET